MEKGRGQGQERIRKLEKREGKEERKWKSINN